MNEINRERFEAWLFSQQKDREFDYTDLRECLICKFIRETSSLKVRMVTPGFIALEGSPSIPMPKWLDTDDATLGKPSSLLATGHMRHTQDGMIPFSEVTKRYVELFGDPSIVESVELPKARKLFGVEE
jgi:hypothetical protein